MSKKDCDLLIVGGGPAGLSAAINGASEGLKIVLMDSGPELGGQAVRSSLIENYPGFPEGIAGNDLMGRCVRQANKFLAEISCPQTAVSLRREGDLKIINTDDEQEFSAKTVILAAGLSYRRLGLPGISTFMGRGILYGAPTTDPRLLGKCTVSIVGGANSAGQAAMHLASAEGVKIKILIRKTIDAQMSQYLIDRIRSTPNIEVIEGTEVIGVGGDDHLKEITVRHTADGTSEKVQTDHLFIFIGATPKTFWLNGTVAMDEKKFIVTGHKLVGDETPWGLKWEDPKRLPFSFETSMPGVFSCGDVRLGSTKRIVSAVGEGSVAL